MSMSEQREKTHKQKDFLNEIINKRKWHNESISVNEIRGFFDTLNKLEGYITKLDAALKGDLTLSTSVITKNLLRDGHVAYKRLIHARNYHPQYRKREEERIKRLKEKEEKKRLKKEQSEHWAAEGLCRICGSNLGGLFSKKCKASKQHKQ